MNGAYEVSSGAPGLPGERDVKSEGAEADEVVIDRETPSGYEPL